MSVSTNQSRHFLQNYSSGIHDCSDAGYAAITEVLTKRDREERSLRRQHPELVTGAADIPEHHSGLKGSSRDRVINQDTSQYVRLCESYHSLIHYTTSTCTHTHTHTHMHTHTRIVRAHTHTMNFTSTTANQFYCTKTHLYVRPVCPP